MPQYAALDVSNEETAIHIINEARATVRCGKRASDPDVLATALRRYAPDLVRVGLDPLHRATRRGGGEPSVGSVGDSYDNALAETINGLFKAEVIHRRGPWLSFEAGEFATLEWVNWFNTRRLLESIGSIPPAEAEERYYAHTEVQTLGA